MTGFLLSEPGILLRMVSPEPAGSGPGFGPGETLPAERLAPWRGVLLAGAFGAAAAWFLLDAALGGVRTTQLQAPRWIDQVPLFGLAAFGVITAAVGRARVVALAAALGLTFAAVAGFVGNDGVRLGIQALALCALGMVHGEVYGSGAYGGGARAGRRPWWGVLAALAAAGVAVFVWQGMLPRLGAEGMALMSSVGALLLVPWPVSDHERTRSVSFALRFAMVAAFVFGLAWYAAPPSLWRGLPTVDRAVFVVLAVGAASALFTRHLVLALGLAIVVPFATAVSSANHAPLDEARHRLLGVDRTSVAAYDRARQAMLLLTDGEVVDEAGADAIGPELGTTLVRCLARRGDRILVLGEGTARLPEMLVRSGSHEVEVVDGHAGSMALHGVLAQDGPTTLPVPAAAEPAVLRRVGGWFATLCALPHGSRQVVVMAAVPVAGGVDPATTEAQDQLRRVAGDGLVLQSVALDRVSPVRLRALLGAAAASHPWNGVVAVGGAAWILSAGAPPAWPAAETMSRWPVEAQWIAHRAHLGSIADVQRALLGAVRTDRSSEGPGRSDGAPGKAERVPVGRQEAWAVLREWLGPAPVDTGASDDSVLLGWLGRDAALRAAVATIRGLGGAEADQRRAQAIAAGFLHIGAPAACLQAALGLPDADGTPLVAPEVACLRAHALDPTLFLDLPPVLHSLRRPRAERGDLEDFAHLPESARLAELCAADTPLAVALRSRFPSRCARALVEQLAIGPLPEAKVEALRELVDPFVLAAAGAALQARAALPELLALWRADLPMPAALGAMRSGDLAQRRMLAAALGGRRDVASMAALAGFLVADEHELRRVAGSSLRLSYGERVPYDPEWPRSALIEAADRLRALHNRHP